MKRCQNLCHVGKIETKNEKTKNNLLLYCFLCGKDCTLLLDYFRGPSTIELYFYLSGLIVSIDYYCRTRMVRVA